MDLLVIDDNRDLIAVKKGCCMNCAETKLKCKIIRIFTIDPKEFKELKNLGVQGVIVKCECGNFTEMDYKIGTKKEKKRDYQSKEKIENKGKEEIDYSKN